MGCEDVELSKQIEMRPGVAASNPMGPDCQRMELNLCMSSPDDDYTQVLEGQAPLHDSAEQKRIAVFKGNESSSFNSLCSPLLLIRSRSKRSASLDFLEYVLPSGDTAQLGCKAGGRSSWRNLMFWRRPKKNAVASFSVASSPEHPAFRPAGRKQKTSPRATKRDVGGPVYSDGTSILPGPKSIHQPPCPIIIAPLSSKSDGSFCPYMPLNRSPRIPSGPLYLP